MPKEMISIPEGNLLGIAKSKGIATLSALKERTGVDRKTLRAINEGQPVKQTTLQSIADKLRIPIAHLLASNAADKMMSAATMITNTVRSNCNGLMALHCGNLLARPMR
jgi:hypothetical protein